MAGYCGFSKSNNAVAAEFEGKYSATEAARLLGVSAAAIKAILRPCEWHHTGSHYRKTDYYDISEILDESEEGQEILKDLKAYKADKIETQSYIADVKFLTWEGSRAHPKAIEHAGERVKVEQRGKKLTIHLPDGVYVKMEGSNGTIVRRAE